LPQKSPYGDLFLSFQEELKHVVHDDDIGRDDNIWPVGYICFNDLDPILWEEHNVKLIGQKVWEQTYGSADAAFSQLYRK